LIAAAGVLFFHPPSDRILLVRRTSVGDFADHWSVPGGKIEDGESAQEAAVREVHEELGPDVVFDTVEPWTRTVANGIDFTCFLCKVPEEFVPRLNEEHDDFRWADRKALMNPEVPVAHADAEPIKVEVEVAERHPIVTVGPDGSVHIYRQ